ncbi:MAG: hypothetical protein LDL31_01220 [Prosthecobacter sp.]|jgi:hypothetical protein|nr:hypothetical protein [Prosthecobacter sp.]
MKRSYFRLLVLICLSGSPLFADDAIEQAMKKYHKAPQGTDPVCKKVSNGEATADQLSELLKAYEAMAAAKPPKGNQASWDEKNQALISAVKKIQGGDASGVSDYKKAVNCKACHSVHKPD